MISPYIFGTNVAVSNTISAIFAIGEVGKLVMTNRGTSRNLAYFATS